MTVGPLALRSWARNMGCLAPVILDAVQIITEMLGSSWSRKWLVSLMASSQPGRVRNDSGLGPSWFTPGLGYWPLIFGLDPVDAQIVRVGRISAAAQSDHCLARQDCTWHGPRPKYHIPYPGVVAQDAQDPRWQVMLHHLRNCLCICTVCTSSFMLTVCVQACVWVWLSMSWGVYTSAINRCICGWVRA